MLLRNVRIHNLLLTADCEVFALDKDVVKTDVNCCVVGYWCWCWYGCGAW